MLSDLSFGIIIGLFLGFIFGLITGVVCERMDQQNEEIKRLRAKQDG